jgi:hypothetical protein
MPPWRALGSLLGMAMLVGNEDEDEVEEEEGRDVLVGSRGGVVDAEEEAE